ncbi:major facilitator superfamily domain-containing protein [Ampelomyces quisqualis]|uniref:Major facilitator superfamily domain-containing protein n=1 Tax=Ampelomyces quisqualis TaxID=50730 RepID=A0A6A5Q8L1_AMPQU|nr:major facilitator superfamily domain-containing protein [Ampelomyces quisqualis]
MASTSNNNENSPLLHNHEINNSGTPKPAQSNTALPMFKIAAAMYSFSLLGLFASSIGALIPLLSSHYSLSDIHVSLLFLAGPTGYILAAQASSLIHFHLGQRGIAFLGPVFQVAAASLIAIRPKFGWVCFGFAVNGLGTGLLDGSWCAWAGGMEGGNVVSGFLHGGYSVGGAGGPFLVTLMVEKGWAWWSWYWVLVMLSVIDFVVLLSAFSTSTASVYRQNEQSALLTSILQPENHSPTTKLDAKAIFRYPATWLCAAYFLSYVGTETAVSGWVVSFMLRNRNATPYLASLCSSGFWIGMAVGRLVLGFFTERIGVRRAVVLYFLCAIGLEILFAALSFPLSSIILMTMLGSIMGPLFPSGVVVLTRLLPGELHIATVSFVSSLGQVGGAFLPFAIGAVVQSLGIGVFQYAILAQTVLALVVWVVFARVRPRTTALGSVARERDGTRHADSRDD